MSWPILPRGWGGLWLAMALALLCPGVRADTPVTLFQSFAGNVNFTGTQVTMRTNVSMCDAYPAKTTLTKALSGIPAGAQILSAHLYWAGSSATSDYQVTFEGKNVSAARRYTSRYTTNGQNYDYFAGAADVTATVAAKGNGTYSFSGLTINNRNPYCAVEGVLGGFALLVVYSSAAEPFRVLNIYEGFQNMRYSSITLNLSNFKVPQPLGTATGRIGAITWEGDLALAQQGEDLKFNGTVMADAMNPSGSQFNSKSNINNDAASYGIDFDAYTVGDPVIQAGQTTATTVYSAGQDMVLLNAEIVAVPNVSVADLQVSMTRSGDPFAGQGIGYTLTVRNNGPNKETGPITVTDTLPAGMTFGSASGTGWTCGYASGMVTCSSAGPLDNGLALQPITITANVTSPGGYSEYTNTASVAGQLFDNVTGNNTATDTASDPVLAGASYAFTDRPCTSGVSMSDSTSPCHRFTGPFVAGETKGLYVTALTNGVPTALHPTNQRQRTMRFSLSCVNPVRDAGVTAKFAGLTLPACLQNGATPTAATPWSGSASVVFLGGQPSSGPHNVEYPDVGLVLLSLRDTGSGDIASARFVSRPARLRLTVARQNGEPNPGANNGNTLGFVKAGEPFSVSIKVLMNDLTNSPPNFGKETTAVDVTLGQDVGPPVAGTFGAGVNGLYAGSFIYDDAGDIKLTARLMTAADAEANHYLGAAVPVDIESERVVGRFYPAYFKTATSSGFDCLAAMGCPSGKAPTGEDLAPGGAAYSGQPFNVTVTAYGLTKQDPLKRYVVGSTSENAITLSAWTKPGPSGAAVNGTFRGQTTIANMAAGATLVATPNYQLPAASPNAGAPATIYLRAEATETRAGKPNETITSKRDPALSVEDGMQVISGRLQVGNGAGSELLKLPIKLNAQYWTGSSWERNSGDNSSIIRNSALFTDCTNKLKSASAAPENCMLAVGVLDAPASVTLVDGSATLWLKPPGAGNNGSAKVKMKESDPQWPSWLPSTIGRAVFGIYKSPLIYIREVY